MNSDMKIIFDDTPTVEELYLLIKAGAKSGVYKREDVEAIAELTTELANRLKVEESD